MGNYTEETKAPRQASKYFIELESLRGIAALAVAVYHINWLFPGYHNGFVRNSYLMVDFFFVLSGFVMCHTYAGKIHGGRDIPWFMWLRFGRIYPLHLLMLLVFLGIETAKYSALQWGLGGGSEAPFSVNDGPSFVKNLFLIHGLGIDHSSFNYPSWSVSTEFFVYLVFATVASLLNKNLARATATALMMIAVSTATILALGKRDLFFTMDFGVLRCVMGFFWGVLAYQAFVFVEHRRNFAGKRDNAVFSPLLLLATMVFVATKSKGYTDFLLPPLVAVLIFSIAAYPSRISSRLLSWSPIAWLGRVSYSIYMVHAAVMWACYQVLELLLSQRQYTAAVVDGHTRSVLTPEPHLAALMAVASIVVVLVISSFTFRFVEEAFRRGAKRLAGKWFPAAVSPSPQARLAPQ